MDISFKVLFLEWDSDNINLYGPHTLRGQIIFHEKTKYQNVLLQAVNTDGEDICIQSPFIEKPIGLANNSSGCGYWILPHYKQCFTAYAQKHVYNVITDRLKSRSESIFSFSEDFKLRLCEVFKGIMEIHAAQRVHGSVNGETMVLVEIGDNDFVGKIIGVVSSQSSSSVSTSSDWKDAARFLEGLIGNVNTYKYDSEIQDLIATLKDDNATDDQIVDHIALWPVERKVTLIRRIDDGLYSKYIQLDQMRIIGNCIWPQQFVP